MSKIIRVTHYGQTKLFLRECILKKYIKITRKAKELYTQSKLAFTDAELCV